MNDNSLPGVNRATAKGKIRDCFGVLLGPVAEPIVKAIRAMIVMVCHTAVAALIVTGISHFEGYLHHLGSQHGRDMLIFDRFPLRYLFQAIDVGVIAAFGFQGMREAWQAFGGHE